MPSTVFTAGVAIPICQDLHLRGAFTARQVSEDPCFPIRDLHSSPLASESKIVVNDKYVPLILT